MGGHGGDVDVVELEGFVEEGFREGDSEWQAMAGGKLDVEAFWHQSNEEEVS